jgi:Bacterial TSP3 repeat
VVSFLTILKIRALIDAFLRFMKTRIPSFGVFILANLILFAAVWGLGAEMAQTERSTLTGLADAGLHSTAAVHTDGGGTARALGHALSGAGSAPRDTDGDGQSDEAELRAGTDPNNPNSVFKILMASPMRTSTTEAMRVRCRFHPDWPSTSETWLSLSLLVPSN